MNFTSPIRALLSRVLLLLGLGLIAFGLAPKAEAQTDIFKRNSTATLSANTSWSTTSGGGTSPPTGAPNATEIGVFDSTVVSGNVAQTTSANFTIGGLKVINPGGAITINGTGAIRTITLGNSSLTDAIDLTTATQNLSLLSNISITLATAQTWAVGNATTARTLTVNGTVTNSGDLLTLDGNGTIAIGGIISGTGGVTIANSSLTANLSGLDTYTGNTTLSAGTLTIGASNVTLKASTLNFTGGTIGFGALNNSTLGGLAGTQNLALATSFALTLNAGATDTDTYSGTLSGTSATVTSSGAGTQTLSGNNSYTGLTTITAGTLVLAGNNTAATGGVTLTAGSLDINNATALGTGTFTITAGNLDNTSGANVVNSNNNVEHWNGNFTYTGTGNLDLGTGAVTMNASRTLTISANTLTVGGAISGSGFSLTKAGAGTLVLTGNESYTGLTTISTGNLVLAGNNTAATGGVTLTAGSLDINNATALGTGTLTITAGNLDNTSGGDIVNSNNNAQHWNGNFTFIGTGNLDLGTGAVTLSAARTLTISANTLTVGGVISGAFALTKNGTGTLVLSSASSNYTGVTTINGGILAVNTLAAGAAVSGIGNSTNAAANLIINGGTLQYLGGGSSTDRDFTIGTNNATIDASGTAALTMSNTTAPSYSSNNVAHIFTLTGNNANANTFAAPINNDGTTGLTTLVKSGTGEWVLTGNGNYTGGATLSDGTLVINTNGTTTTGALGNNATLTISGGNLDTTNANTAIATINPENWNSDFTFVGTGNLSLGTGAVTLGASRTVTISASTLTVGGTISGTGFSLTKSGAGNLVLTGVDSYTGGTTVNAGMLSFNGANTFTAGTVTVAGGTLNFNNAGALGSNAVILTMSGGNLDATNGTIVNSHVNAQNWNSDFTFTGTNSLDLGTGAVALSASRTVTVSANTLTVGGVISGSGFSLTKDGAGTLNLTGAESYTGGTTVNTGTLNFNGTNTFTAGTVTLAGGTLDFNNASALGSNAVIFTITGGNLDATNGAITNSHVNAENWNGDFTFIGTNSLNLGTGGITLGSDRIVTVSASTLTIGGVISDGGSGFDLTMNGAGTLALNGADTFSGNMNLTNNNGTLTLGNLNALQDATLNYTSNTTLNLATGTNVMGGLAGSSNIALGTNNLTLNMVTGLTDTYSGNLSGTGNLTKSGLGTEVLTGASTYTGGTHVSGGILEVSGNNSLGAAGHPTTVSSGATLQLDNGFDITGAGQTSGSSNGSLLTISGTGVGGNGALVNGNGTAEWQGNVALGAAATIGSGSTASGCITVGNNLGAATSNISLNTFDLTFVGAASTTTNVTANIIGSTGNVHINTAGTVNYGMDGNGYLGTTFVDNGTLILDTTDNSIPLSPGSGNLLAINGPLVIGDGTGAANTAIVQMGATTPDSARFTISQNSTVTVNQDGLFAVYGQDQTIGALTMNGGNIDTTDHANSITGLLGLNGNATILANANSSTISGNFLMANSAGNSSTVFTVTSGGNVNGDLVVNALLSGGAMVKNGNGTMVLTNNLNSYTGTTEVQTGTLNIQAAGALGATDGSATEGTTVDNGGQLQIQGSINVANEYLTLNGVGTNATTGATVSDGALLNKAGSNTWGGTINVASSADINTTAGTSLYVSGNVTTAGTTTLTFNGNGATTISGNINGGLSVVKNGTGTLMYNGTLANTNTGSTTVNTGTLELNKTAGTVALSGSSITINSGGTLLSQNSENIGNGVNMVLNGGTWTTNGASASTFTENLNTLTLTATSTLNLGANTNTVAYTDSSGTTWTGGSQLLIDNWNGLLAGAGTDEVFFGSSAGGLTGTSSSGQLGDIIFVDPIINGVATSTDFHAIILSTGEVVPFMPAPEPGTVAAGAALGALALVRELRRRKARVAISVK